MGVLLYTYEELPPRLKVQLTLIVGNVAADIHYHNLHEKIGDLTNEEGTPEMIRESIYALLEEELKMTTNSRKHVANLEPLVFEVYSVVALEMRMKNMKKYSQGDLYGSWTGFNKFVQELKGDFLNQELKMALEHAAKPTFVKIRAETLEEIVQQLHGIYTVFDKRKKDEKFK
jgi:hypothetical protein